jgi:hypothetical protein
MNAAEQVARNWKANRRKMKPLNALLVWVGVAILALVLYSSMGYLGFALVAIPALIFLFCFVALKSVDIVMFFVGLLGGVKKDRPPAPPPPYTPPAELQYCPKCGSAWVRGAQSCANCS